MSVLLRWRDLVPSQAIRSLGLALSIGVWMVVASGQQSKAQAAPSNRLLYSLETNCSVKGADHRCRVEAFDGEGSTVYRTIVDKNIISYRLVDQPSRKGAQLWDQEKKTWVALERISLDFKSNELCINGDQLCVENPNYFGSLRESYPDLRSDYILAVFNPADGELAAICYSHAACDAGF